MRFALSGDDAQRARFKAALAAFPNDLPYEVKEGPPIQPLPPH